MAIHEPVLRPIPHVERPIADPPRPQPTRRRRRVAGDYGLMGVALLAGAANVIMELARPGVGYGVAESRVESGRIDRHPIKRARTTFTYVAVANAGTESQKAAFRRAVNRAHAQVYSTPDSPVSYNAFDPELQLWVAACIYKGGIDVYRTFVGELDDEDADRLYREGMSIGTTLQVPPEMWPPDRAAFDRYWQESLEKVHIDDTVREFLYPIAVSRIRGVALPGPLRRLVGKLQLADHHRLSAATVSRRDGVAVGCRQTAALRPADGGAGHGEQHAAAGSPAVPVQSDALGFGSPDQDGAPLGLAAARDRRFRLITTIIFIKLSRVSPPSPRSTYDCADLDGIAAGGALGAAQQRSGAGFACWRRPGRGAR